MAIDDLGSDLDYCDAIYRHFVERRAHGLLLNVRDWEQILAWRERGVPLGLILGVIDRSVERSEGHGAPIRLTELGPLVRGAHLDLQKASVAQPSAAEQEPTFEPAFVRSQILEPALERLKGGMPATPEGENAWRSLRRAVDRFEHRPHLPLTAEQLLRWESRANRQALEAAEQAASAELLAEARRQAEQAATTTGRASETVRAKLYHLCLRRQLGLPSLRLFVPDP